MKHKLQITLMTLGLILGIGSFVGAPVGAINVFKSCSADPSAAVCQSKGESINNPVQTVINTMLFAIGVVSVIMIIVGGLRYTTSNGDTSKVTSAKNTILYAVVGLVVALLAYAIVNFVVAQFK